MVAIGHRTDGYLNHKNLKVRITYYEGTYCNREALCKDCS